MRMRFRLQDFVDVLATSVVKSSLDNNLKFPKGDLEGTTSSCILKYYSFFSNNMVYIT